MFENTKDLLGLKDLTADQIKYILKAAENMKYILKQNNKKAPHLAGKSIMTLFYENSTRTRMSFELAGKFLSASFSNINVSTSSVSKGETLIDTGRTIDRMGTDLVIIRHSMAGAPHLLAKNISASVINAGDGMNEHPTQALLDMLTIKEQKCDFKGLKVAILGDIFYSRVARSNIFGLKKLGAEINIGGPATLIPQGIEKLGVNVFNSVQEALIDADVVMGLRIQLERQKEALFPTLREYNRFFGIDEKRLKFAKKDAILLHPGPVNRGVELSSAVIDSEKSFIEEQVTNGVAVRMALLYIFSRRSVNIENIN